MKTIYKIVLGSVIALGSQYASGANQIVSTDPASVTAAPGSEVSFDVVYNTDDGNAALTGLGLRIHYDSSKLEWVGFEGVERAGLVTKDSAPQDDVKDFDHDADTDKYLGFGWISVMGQWPGNVPADLFRVRFRVAPGVDEATSTRVNFSSSSKVPHYGFQSVPGVVDVQP